jgi:lipid-A-disaccharide synthase
MSLLVVAGEASGDAMAAPVVARLGANAFGLGGPALAAARVELVAHLTTTAVMGFGAVARRAPRIARVAVQLLHEARRRRPRAALLVGYSEFNAWLGPRLRALGTRVLWYGAPQIWAWRSGRAARLRRACDRMALVLPFEEVLWRAHGVDARYVGHPALERSAGDRATVRARLGLTPYAECVAVLPGSRPHEVRRHLEPMLAAIALLRSERGAIDARVVVASSLDAGCGTWVRRRAAAAGVETFAGPPAAMLCAFDVALVKSGTATLECALAEVAPVIVYRAGPISALLAKHLLRVQQVGLPNLVLGESVFPELLQERVTADDLAFEAQRLLDDRAETTERCRRVALALRAGLPSASNEPRPSERVARMMRPWL